MGSFETLTVEMEGVKSIPGSSKAGAKARHRENHKKQNASWVLSSDCPATIWEIWTWLVFVDEARELTGTRLRSSTAWLMNVVNTL